MQATPLHARCLRKLLCASCSAQGALRTSAQSALCKQLCASYSAQAALRKLFCAVCPAEDAVCTLLYASCCANCSVRVVLCKLLCASCFMQVALRKSLCARAVLRKLLCTSCSATRKNPSRCFREKKTKHHHARNKQLHPKHPPPQRGARTAPRPPSPMALRMRQGRRSCGAAPRSAGRARPPRGRPSSRPGLSQLPSDWWFGAESVVWRSFGGIPIYPRRRPGIQIPNHQSKPPTKGYLTAGKGFSHKNKQKALATTKKSWLPLCPKCKTIK